MYTMLENIIIGKPLEEVFAFASDIENDTLYRKDILEVKWVSALEKRLPHTQNLLGNKSS